MAQSENVAAIENAVAQMNSGNLEGYLELYSDNLTLHGYPPGVEGKAGVSEFYAAFARATRCCSTRSTRCRAGWPSASIPRSRTAWLIFHSSTESRSG